MHVVYPYLEHGSLDPTKVSSTDPTWSVLSKLV